MLPRNCVRSGRNSLNHTGSMATNLQNKIYLCCYVDEFPQNILYGIVTYITV